MAVHPLLSKAKGTRSANAFGNERMVGFLTWREAAKDAVLAAGAFTMVFSCFILRCVTFLEGLLKSREGTHCTKCKSARN